MIIVLIFFVLFIFPVKLNLRAKIIPKENLVLASLSVFRLQIIKFSTFIYNKEIYYKISKGKIKKLKINLKRNGKKHKLNFIIIKKILIDFYFGSQNMLATVLVTQFIRIFSYNFNQIKNIKINIKSYPLYNYDNFYLKANLSVYTNLSYLALSIISRIVKGEKNDKRKSN